MRNEAPCVNDAFKRSAAEAEFDCRECGACCAPELPLPIYVSITRRDAARLTPRWRNQHVGQGSILTKLDPVGRCVCVALRGAVGRRVSCSIYERRPIECRRLERGSAACKKARRQLGVDA